MKQNYDRILEEIFRHEGGYVDHPSDPGGATNMGITHKTLASWRKVSPWTNLPKSEVKNLKKQEAAKIYEANYWKAVRGDDLPSGVDCYTMDYGVNSGPSRAIRDLQAVLGVTVDGVIGPNTLEALRKSDPLKVVTELHGRRMAFLKSLKTWGTFGKGWTRRTESVLKLSQELSYANPRGEQTVGSGNLLAILVKFILNLLRR